MGVIATAKGVANWTMGDPFFCERAGGGRTEKSEENGIPCEQKHTAHQQFCSALLIAGRDGVSGGLSLLTPFTKKCCPNLLVPKANHCMQPASFVVCCHTMQSRLDVWLPSGVVPMLSHKPGISRSQHVCSDVMDV